MSHVPVGDALNGTQLQVKGTKIQFNPKGACIDSRMSHTWIQLALEDLELLASLPALAKVERLFFDTVNVRTQMLDLSRLDYLDATKTLRI